MSNSFDLEWEGVDEQQTGEPVPPGEYNCEVEAVEVRQSDEEGSFPYMSIQLRIVDGDHVERRLWYNASAAPKAIGFTKRVMRSFGVDTSQNFKVQYDDDGTVSEPDLIGKSALAKVARRIRGKDERGQPMARYDTVSLDGGLGEEGEAPTAAPVAAGPRRPAGAARPATGARPAATGARPGPRRIYR